MACTVVDRAMQAFGAEGISQDQQLAQTYAQLRTLRFADGPDEVHMQQVGRNELKRAPGLLQKQQESKRKEKALLEKAGLTAKL